MKTRKTFEVIVLMVITFLSIFIFLFLHELGHSLFALITGNEVKGIMVGEISYAYINMKNMWSVPLISIGSFILPLIICGVLSLFKNKYIRVLNISFLVSTISQLILNAVVIMFGKSDQTLNEYDLGIFIKATGFNEFVVGIIALCIVCIIAFWCLQIVKRFVNDML